MSTPADREPCPFCGQLILKTAQRCRFCGEELYEDVEDDRPRGGGDASMEQGLQWLLPVGRSGWSIAAGYLGLVSCVPVLGAACGILAIIFGVLGLASSKKHPRLGGRGRAIFGIIVGTLSLLIHLFALIIALSMG